jgi:hypothetical protein
MSEKEPRGSSSSTTPAAVNRRLSPCPICGEAPEVRRRVRDYRFQIVCSGGEMRVHVLSASERSTFEKAAEESEGTVQEILERIGKKPS